MTESLDPIQAERLVENEVLVDALRRRPKTADGKRIQDKMAGLTVKGFSEDRILLEIGKHSDSWEQMSKEILNGQQIEDNNAEES